MRATGTTLRGRHSRFHDTAGITGPGLGNARTTDAIVVGSARCPMLVPDTGVMRTLGREHLDAAVSSMVDAFWDYPETVHLLRDEKRRRHVLPRYLRSDLRDALRFDLLLGAEREGRIVGAAAWIPPGAYPPSARRQITQVLDVLPAAPWGWHSLREARRGQAANRAHHRGHPPHFYLRAIGVASTARGHGLGSSLVWPVVERADELGAGCFLQTATADNVRWYGQFGFEVVAAYKPTPDWPHVWAMWRSPASG